MAELASDFGQYTGLLRYQRVNNFSALESTRYQLVKIDFIPLDTSQNPARLMAILTLYFGDFGSREYVSFVFDDVRYDATIKHFTFERPRSNLKIKCVEVKDGRILADVLLPPAADGVTARLYVSKEGIAPAYPLIPRLNGEYAGKCYGRDLTLQVTAFRSLDEADADAGPYSIYNIVGLRGHPNLVLTQAGFCFDFETRNPRPCVVEGYSAGRYNFFTGEVNLVGNRSTLQCWVREKGLFCPPCALNRLYKPWVAGARKFTDGEDFPHLRPRTSTPNFSSAPPDDLDEAEMAAQFGSSRHYVGYLHHEYLNEYQWAALEVEGADHDPKTAKNASFRVTAKLAFLGPIPDVLKYDFSVKGDTLDTSNFVLRHAEAKGDAILQITSYTPSTVEGIWYSTYFGRVGKFQLCRRKACSAAPKPLMTSPAGVYNDNFWQIGLSTSPNGEMNGSDPFRPRQIRLSAKHPKNPTGFDNFGSYKTKNDCERDLPAQRALFQRATGLRILLAYCWQANQLTNHEWAHRIDAVGKSKLHMILVREQVGPEIYQDVARTQKELTDRKKALEAMGFPVSRVFLSIDVTGNAYLETRYYGTSEAQFRRPGR